MSLIPLGTTARFINGVAFKPSDWGAVGLPIIRIQNLTGTGEEFNYTTRQVKPELIVEPGDLLVSWSATLDVYRWSGPRGVLNQHIFKVIPNSGVDSEYLYFALKSVIAELESKTHGSTMKHVVRGDFEGTRIPLPSLDEQLRTVDLLSRAEGIVRLRREAQKTAAEIIPALFLDTFGDPATNAKGYVSTRLADIAEVVSGITKGRKLNGRAARPVPYLRVANVQAGFLNLEEMKEIEATDVEIEALKLRSGDIVLTEGGDFDKLGRGAQWRGEIPTCIHQNHVFRVRLRSEAAVPDYFEAYLQTSTAKSYFLSVAKRTTNLASINMTQLRNLPVVLPTIATQREFCERVAATRSIISFQGSAIEKAEVAFAALLDRAFSGGKWLPVEPTSNLVASQ